MYSTDTCSRLSELDSATEYFIDEKAQQLYFIPPEGQSITAKPVTLSVNHSAVVSLAAGTAHVQFVDLTVGFGRSTGVAATTVDNVLVKNCTVSSAKIRLYGKYKHQPVCCWSTGFDCCRYTASVPAVSSCLAQTLRSSVRRYPTQDVQDCLRVVATHGLWNLVI